MQDNNVLKQGNISGHEFIVSRYNRDKSKSILHNFCLNLGRFVVITRKGPVLHLKVYMLSNTLLLVAGWIVVVVSSQPKKKSSQPGHLLNIYMREDGGDIVS